jgi:GxxExxY protein
LNFQANLLKIVEKDQLIIENKTVKSLNEIHLAQILSYLRLSEVTGGYLINGNVRHLKDGIKRVVLNR